MKTLAELIKIPSQEDFQTQEKLPDKPQQNFVQPLTQEVTSSEVVVYSADDQKRLITCLSACMAVQRTYGKQAQELPEVIKVFKETLSDYPPAEVIEAIQIWLKKSPEFPTPADIEGILNPQPKFDYAVYSALNERLKRGDRLSYTQKEYLAAYEENAMRGL